jgi:hypothetical protein
MELASALPIWQAVECRNDFYKVNAENIRFNEENSFYNLPDYPLKLFF